MTTMLILFIGLMLLLFFTGVPVFASLGLTSMAVLLVQNDFTTLPCGLLALKMVDGINSYLLLAAPFYVFAATCMNQGSTTQRLFDFVSSLVGHIRGGLGHVNIMGSMVFAGISGTAVADAAGLGAIEIKAMLERGYSKRYTIGITGASSILGPIIPPSVGMVVYGWLGDVSVAKLFIAGVLPGILLALVLMIQTVIMSYREFMPLTPRPPFREIVRHSRRASLVLLCPLIIVVGMWTGWLTPTEAGVVASAYALFLGTVIYKDVKAKDLIGIFRTTIEFTGIIMFIIAVAILYGWLLIRLQIPHALAEYVVGLSMNTTVLLFLICFFFMIVGCFMSAIEAILIFTPIMVPMIEILGIDPIHFGVLMVLTLSVGVITPPFGNVLFVFVRITGEPFEEVVKAQVPFYLSMVVTIALLIAIPWLSTYLPSLLTNVK